MVLPEKPHITITISVFLLGLILGGLFTGLYFNGKLNKAKSDCAAEQTAAGKKEKGAAAVTPAIPKVIIPNEIYSVSGQISKIDGNTLVVKSSSFGEEKSYTVKVVDGTKIVKREIITSPPEAKEGKPASPFKTTDAKLSDLEENSFINVEASENIKNKSEFEAKIVYIEIMNMPVPPAPSTGDNPKTPTIPAPPIVVPAQ